MRLVIALLLLASTAHADRAAYVDRALTAVKALGADGRDKLDLAVYTASRGKCHADTGKPAGHCLIDAAKGICAGNADCAAAADVIATNLLSVDEFVDEPKRMRIVQGATDYRKAIGAELRSRYALLAAELATASPKTDGAAIDRMCRDRDIAIHACLPGDAGCIPSISWSRCVAAVVWFVGGTP